MAALTAAPGATAAQLAEAAGITRAAAARELAALEKAGHATWDRNASPAIWTAGDAPGAAPGPDSLDPLAPPHSSPANATGTAAREAEAPGAGNPGP
jgi:hypothetical protein